ncbi:MAG: formylglycine-generating enzyme family protein [Planctomycetota bacterium]|jgi:formylglycine-generating enzyme required for sulfatase activity
MPVCIECNESFAGALRRCPHCGAVQRTDEPLAPNPLLTKRGKRNRLNRRVAYLGALLLVACVGVVAMGGGDSEESIAGGGDYVRPVTPPRPRKPVEIKRMDVNDSFKIESARLVGDRIHVEGSCSPIGVVKIHVAGFAAVIAPNGSRFHVDLPAGLAEVDVVAEDVDGNQVRTTAPVRLEQDSFPVDRLPVTSHVDGQTVHVGSVRLVYRGDVREDPKIVKLPRLENRIEEPLGRMTLYRAPEGLVFLRLTESGHYTFLRERDGQEMVLLPTGLARRGSGDKPPYGPSHVVRLTAYLIDRTEVSCSQYATFLTHMTRVGGMSARHPDDPGGSLRPAGWSSNDCPTEWEDLPVTGVSWFAAYAYARWVGGRLPTEAEWERAAASPRGRTYPWGDEFDARRSSCRGALVPVDSLPGGASENGILHMAGNAREWCDDRYDPRWYRMAARLDPRGPSRNKQRVVRGGSCTSPLDPLRSYFRDHADPKSQPVDVGFRVVRRWTALPPPRDE